MPHTIDLDVAKEEFKRRYQENSGQQIDNSSLYAGSPMYYYCHGCCILVDTKPESWVHNPPPKHCDACKILDEHGMIDGLITEIKKEKE